MVVVWGAERFAGVSKQVPDKKGGSFSGLIMYFSQQVYGGL
jgi:hypothetical protein